MEGNHPIRRSNPLDVASLTTPSTARSVPKAKENDSDNNGGDSSSSSSSSNLLDKGKQSEVPALSQQKEAPGKSSPFTCSSVVETLKSHGASFPPRLPKFIFQIRQQPKHGLSVGFDETAYKNARAIPLDPMPICEMIPESGDDLQYISLPEVSVQAHLVNSEYPYQEIIADSKALEPLINGVQESSFIAPIAERHEECLFIFAELGVRNAGNFRIRFDLIDRIGLVFKKVASIYTQRFKIVSDKRSFSGLNPSSELVHQLVRRGLKLRIIKDRLNTSKKVSPSSSSSQQQLHPSTQQTVDPYKRPKTSQDSVAEYRSSTSPNEESLRSMRSSEGVIRQSQSQATLAYRMQSQYQPEFSPQPHASAFVDPPWIQSTPQFLQQSSRSASYADPREVPPRVPYQAKPLRVSPPFGGSRSREGEHAEPSRRVSGWLRRDLPLPFPLDPLSLSTMSSTTSSTAASRGGLQDSSSTSDSSIYTPSQPSMDRSYLQSSLHSRPTPYSSHPYPSSTASPPKTLQDTRITSLAEMSAPFYPSMHLMESARSTSHSGEERSESISRDVTLPPISSFQVMPPKTKGLDRSPPDADPQRRYDNR